MDSKDILKAILQSFHDKYDRWPGKTRLIKLLYLVDLFHTRKFGKRILKENWVYYLYGPYIMNFDELLSDRAFELEEFEYGEDKSGTCVKLSGYDSPAGIPFDLKRVINSAVYDFGELDLRELLDYVYFDTEPMMNAQNRMDNLDFSSVLPEEHYKVRELKIDRKTESKIRKEFREKVKRIKDAKGIT